MFVASFNSGRFYCRNRGEVGIVSLALQLLGELNPLAFSHFQKSHFELYSYQYISDSTELCADPVPTAVAVSATIGSGIWEP